MAKPRVTLSPVYVGGKGFENVPASSTDAALGATGAINDFLARVVVSVATSATSAASIKDGTAGSAIPLVPANTPVGVYSIELGIESKATGGWFVTTAAGVSILAIGDFV